MSEIALSKALCVPALDLEALLQGRTIVALSRSFRNPAHFLLCPVDISIEDTQLFWRYQPNFLRSLRPSSSFANPDTVTIQAWAKGKSCRAYSADDDLLALSKLTSWSADYLHGLVRARHKIFLMFLQVHRFGQPLELMMDRPDEDQLGRYLSVPGTWSDQNTLPLVGDKTFAYRQRQLVQLSPPSHTVLEGLQTELVALRENHLGAMSLDRDLRYFLGWSRAEETQLYDSDLSWIRQIAQVGFSNDNAEFSHLVKKSCAKLGFRTQDELFDFVVSSANDNGTADNRQLDRPNRRESDQVTLESLFNNVDQSNPADTDYLQPYPLRAECLSNTSSSIANMVMQQFTGLKNADVNYEPLQTSVKILFAAGSLTDQAQKSARRHHINVMRPDTLQRLSELKAQYPGAIDLLKLKSCLQALPHGEEADGKINQFILESLYQLRVRAALIEAVKICAESTGRVQVGINAICAAYTVMSNENLPQGARLPSLSMPEVHDILLELSSPVAGYLGRKRADNDRYAFYFLRELSVGDGYLALSLS